MIGFFKKYKGYIFHAAAVGVVFLSPSVQAALLAHPATSGIVALAWGAILHWATGK